MKPVLYLHAPKTKVKGGAKSFHKILSTGIGPGYAVYSSIANQLYPDCDAVLLDKPGKQRAEGKLIRLVQTTEKTPQGIQRYDVYIDFGNPGVVPYKPNPKPFNRFGVAFV